MSVVRRMWPAQSPSASLSGRSRVGWFALALRVAGRQEEGGAGRYWCEEDIPVAKEAARGGHGIFAYWPVPVPRYFVAVRLRAGRT